MPMRLVYVHGWGLEAELWTPLRQRLNVMDDFALNLGFLSPKRDRIPFPTMPYVAIGHSLGLLWLLTQCPDHPWRALISINGFSRFTKTDNFEACWQPRILKRMISALETAPETVYRDFMTRAGQTHAKTDALDTPNLKSGLELLMEADGRSHLQHFKGPVLALSGSKDAIVSEAMTQASFPTADHRILETGDHMMPLSATDWCAAQIQDFLGLDA